jgi:putative serine protease PepD
MIRYRGRLLAVVVTVALAGCSMTTAGAASSSSAATPVADVSPSALALQRQFVQVVKQVGPSVVLIQTSQGLGSGIVFDANGNVVTNAHVVEGASSFPVTLADGKQHPARLVGSFAADDLAVLHIDAGGLHPAGFADSAKLEVGDVALAIGNPRGCSPASPKGSSAPSGAPSTRTTGSRCPT